MRKLKKIGLWAVLVIPVMYISTCTLVAKNKDRAFNLIKIGDTQSDVIRLLGNPSVREKTGALFTRYASQRCQSPCVERLWFENRLALDLEAWSIELAEGDRVIKKTHWVSP